MEKFKLSLLDKFKLLWYNSNTFHRKRNSHSLVSSYAKCQAKIDVAEKKGTSLCSEGEIGRLHLKGVIRFHDRKAYCAFFVPFSLENTFSRREKLKGREVNIITNGGFEVKQMSSSEREAFMSALLERVLGLRRKRKEVDGHAI